VRLGSPAATCGTKHALPGQAQAVPAAAELRHGAVAGAVISEKGRPVPLPPAHDSALADGDPHREEPYRKHHRSGRFSLDRRSPRALLGRPIRLRIRWQELGVLRGFFLRAKAWLDLLRRSESRRIAAIAYSLSGYCGSSLLLSAHLSRRQ